jgi:superfamily II DNA or RNA helicase
VKSEHLDFELRLLPDGVLVVEASSDDVRWAAGVAARFAEDEAAGLFALAAAKVPRDARPSIGYWRDLAADFLRRLCHLPENEAFAPGELEAPDQPQLSEWVLNAPPMPGAEYLTLDGLSSLWERLTHWAVDQAGRCGGLSAFLDTYAPQWSRVGRVTLHLAENKGDEEFPFAVMATYAAGLTRDGRVRRLPLGKALEEYAGARRKPELLKLLSPLHDAAKRSELIAALVETGDIFHPLVWTPAEAHAFLTEIPIYEDCGLLALLPNWWRKRQRPRVSVTLDKPKGSSLGKDALLDFSLSLALGDTQLTAAEAKALLKSQDGLVLLRGEWVEVDSEKLREALAHWQDVAQEAGEGGVSFIEGMRLLAGAPADLKGDGEIGDSAPWALVEPGQQLLETLAGLRSPDGLAGPTPSAFQGELRGYQSAGLNWIWLCANLGVGACLADDMGLGKTIQVLAALLRRQEEAVARKGKKSTNRASLLVVPASLVGNWKAEAARFAPSLNLFVAHPSETPKTTLEKIAADPEKKLRETDLVITTYSMISRLGWLSEVRWGWVILDEAQAIKNPSAKQTKAVKTLDCRARIALTGTPVENRLGDLWSLFDFINPGLLGTAKRFRSFANELNKKEHSRYAPLRNLISPYILRRMKTDPGIAPDLPEKTEMRTFCGLAKPQATLYKQCVTALTEAFKEKDSDGMKRRGLVLSYLMRFKQICNHPSQLTGDGDYDPKASSKFQRLGEICTEIASRGEKVLVFTQFREITDPLAEYLTTVFDRPGLVLHGGTAVKKRAELVADFQRAVGPPFLVMSIKAGGTGLNLTAASHVVHFDRWWNPAVENQATDRAFRIGQQRNVLVHKFVTRGTIEEKIDALIFDKQQMADALLEGGAEKALTELSDDEILEMVSLDIERATV